MADIANRDEAHKCLAIAKRALQEGDLTKAEKFAQKAMKLYNDPQVTAFCLQLESLMSERREGANHSGSSSTANGHAHTSHAGAGGAARRSAHEPAGQRPGSSASQPHGMGGSHRDGSAAENLRHRHTAAPKAEPAPPAEDIGTPEQKALIGQILKAKDLYAILGLEKGATDDDIKKAYKKLALKLHPDKCKASRAEEAFKAVSKAFSCLSDPDKRAYFDRTGYESSAAAAAAAQQSHVQRHQGQNHGNGSAFYTTDDIDPEEIFNMFFGGGFGNSSRVFRAQFGGAAQRNRTGPQTAADQHRHMVLGFLQFLPVLLLLLFTFFSGTQQPVYSLFKDKQYIFEFETHRLQLQFFVKNAGEFERQYPTNSGARFRLEKQVEADWYERLSHMCQNEKLMQHRAWSWGNREQARNMKLESCKQIENINSKLGMSKSANYYF